MLDKLIDLMATLSALDKANTKEELQRQFHEVQRSLKSLENQAARKADQIQETKPVVPRHF